MTKTETITAAKEAGFSHVLTIAGPVPLADWTPYGQGGDQVVFFLDIEKKRIGEKTRAWPQTGFVGSWPLMSQNDVLYSIIKGTTFSE